MNRGIPICEIFHVPETGMFGYCYRFEGQSPHHGLDTCLTFEDALDTCDPHREHIWEEASDADENRLLISRAYKPGSVYDIMSRYEPSLGRGR